MSLPTFFALRSPLLDTYLRFNVSALSSLDFNGNNVFSPLAKFELVPANTGTGLVHIRCCHNRKFIRISSSGSNYFTPEADEPDEDQSFWRSTLFEPQVLEESSGKPHKLVRLLHFSSNRSTYATARTIHAGTGIPAHYLMTGVWDVEPYTFELIDLESLPPVLPKHVTIKGSNGNYLTVDDSNLSFMYLKFTATEKADTRSWFVVTTDGHGRIQIMSYFNKRFWMSTPANTIWPIGSDASSSTTFFTPVEVTKNVFAFQSVDNGNFCGVVENVSSVEVGWMPGADGSLFARYPTIVAETRFIVEELVLSRSIYNAHFDLANAVIYGETPINMVTANASNNTSSENTIEFNLSYTHSKSSAWTSTESKMLGMGASASIRIPYVGSFGTEIYGENAESYEWGDEITSETTLETTYTVAVPPKTSVTVSLMATKGFYDVPFSYYQKDKLYDGTYVIFHKDDGLYTGMECQNFRYEIAETSHDETSRSTNNRVVYMEQKIPMPLEAKAEQSRALASSVLATTQQENSPVLEIESLPLPLKETPLKETPEEQKVELSLEETTSQVQNLVLPSESPP